MFQTLFTVQYLIFIDPRWKIVTRLAGLEKTKSEKRSVKLKHRCPVSHEGVDIKFIHSLTNGDQPLGGALRYTEEWDVHLPHGSP